MAMNTAVWLRIPLLPLEFHDEECMEIIAQKLGKLLKIDKNTSEAKRASYARICVEIDLSKPLTPSIAIGKYDYFIEYEHVHLICFSCGRVGHRKDACNANPAPEKEDGNGIPNVAKPGSSDAKPVRFNGLVTEDREEEIGFGEWMVVSRKKKFQPNKSGPMQPQAQNLNNTKTKPTNQNVRKPTSEDVAGPSKSNGSQYRSKPVHNGTKANNTTMSQNRFSPLQIKGNQNPPSSQVAPHHKKRTSQDMEVDPVEPHSHTSPNTTYPHPPSSQCDARS